MRSRILSSRGSSLIEMSISSILTMIILMAGVALFRPAVDISFLISQQAGMNQTARFSLDVFTTELSLAGNGMTGGGIQLPVGTGVAPKFACNREEGCYILNNTFPGSRLYAIIPGNSKGPTINGVATDVVTFVYVDPDSNLDQYPLTSMTNDRAYFDAGMDPPYNDPVSGARLGDILMLCNEKGCAAGVVTAVVGGRTYFSVGSSYDPIKFNQTAAGYGSLSSIQNPASETRAYRLVVTTFYIDNSNPDVPRLMRQVNTGKPRVAALFVENLQLSYDIFDENSSTVTTNLADAGGNPNQIRKINVSIGARSPVEGTHVRSYERLVLTTSVSARSLRYRDYYE